VAQQCRLWRNSAACGATVPPVAQQWRFPTKAVADVTHGLHQLPPVFSQGLPYNILISFRETKNKGEDNEDTQVNEA
jgi:hypothetical protein